MSIDRVIGFAAIAAGLVVVFMAIGTAQIPGTVDLQNPLSDEETEPQYDLRATVGVEDTLLSAGIVEESFSYSTDESTLASRAIGTLSFLGTEGVEVTATLSGSEIEGVRQKKVNIGRLGELQSEKVVFKATRLPAGTYTLRWDMNWNSGSDQFETEITIPKRGG